MSMNNVAFSLYVSDIGANNRIHTVLTFVYHYNKIVAVSLFNCLFLSMSYLKSYFFSLSNFTA